jgi:succinoglycan biosynthesis protein ExoO
MTNENDSAPRVSVIMANYNGAAHIAEAAQSVLRQTQASLELLLSDDGSSDNSVEVARRAAAGDPRLIILEWAHNGGPAAARNRALDVARGEWIAIVDNDDYIDADRLKQLIDRADADGADIAADNMLTFYDSADAPRRPHLPARLVSSAQWIDAASWVRADNGAAGLGYLKPVFRRAAFGAALRYDESLSIGEDAQLMLQLLSAGARLRLYPSAGYHYRKRVGSISHRRSAAALDAMIAALDRIDARNDEKLRQALAHRRRRLLHTRHFEDLALALKAHDLGAAARLALKRPSALLMLGEPIAKRLGLRPRT